VLREESHWAWVTLFLAKIKGNVVGFLQRKSFYDSHSLHAGAVGSQGTLWMVAFG
jgi:hypothetical protein